MGSVGSLVRTQKTQWPCRRAMLYAVAHALAPSVLADLDLPAPCTLHPHYSTFYASSRMSFQLQALSVHRIPDSLGNEIGSIHITNQMAKPSKLIECFSNLIRNHRRPNFRNISRHSAKKLSVPGFTLRKTPIQALGDDFEHTFQARAETMRVQSYRIAVNFSSGPGFLHLRPNPERLVHGPSRIIDLAENPLGHLPVSPSHGSIPCPATAFYRESPAISKSMKSTSRSPTISSTIPQAFQ